MPIDRQTLIQALRDDLRRAGAEIRPDLAADEPFAGLGVDSLTLAEFVARVEQRFRVAVPDDQWRALGSLDQVADWLEPRLGR